MKYLYSKGISNTTNMSKTDRSIVPIIEKIPIAKELLGDPDDETNLTHFNVPLLYPDDPFTGPIATQRTMGAEFVNQTLYAGNATSMSYPSLPEEMRFNDSHVIRIVGYSALMVMSAVANISLLRSLAR